jgi:Asp-tRNA(Asn)/Glu-tRNA(Gln) amidotransferase A subunit family amidase
MAYQIIDALRANELTLPEYLAQMEAQFNEREPSIHTFLVEENRFVRLRHEADALVLRYPDLINRPLFFGALAGVKDIFHVKDFTTMAGSRLPADVLQGEEAESVSRLKDAGALILGKTVTTEFAYFTPGETRNPHNLEHTPGGSSSGSAAAVAAGICQLALGTQTIGSIIRPASFCGVVGLKPTYDRISREGVIALAPSLDHVGCFAPDVATVLNAGRVLYKDWEEPTQPFQKPRLAIPTGPYLQGPSPESLAHFENVYKRLQNAGYELQRIEIMPDFTEIVARHQVIMSAEAAQVHGGWFDHYENLYSTKFTELIRRGQQITDEQLQAAFEARDTFRSALQQAFLDHNIDLWISPSTLGPAPRGLESTGDPVMNLPWTQAGLPVVNLPAGKDPSGLPLGLQLVGNWYQDEALLFWAKDLEAILSNL